MRSDGYPGIVICCEYIVQDGRASDVLGLRGFGVGFVPQGVILGKAVFESVGGEVLGDEGFAGSAVTGVGGEAFAEEFFDHWDEGLAGGESEVGEGDASSVETAVEGGNIVGLWGWDLLELDLGGPEVVGGLGLGDAGLCEACVCPGHGAVSV